TTLDTTTKKQRAETCIDALFSIFMNLGDNNSWIAASVDSKLPFSLRGLMAEFLEQQHRSLEEESAINLKAICVLGLCVHVSSRIPYSNVPWRQDRILKLAAPSISNPTPPYSKAAAINADRSLLEMDNARQMLEQEIVYKHQGRCFVDRRPLGPNSKLAVCISGIHTDVAHIGVCMDFLQALAAIPKRPVSSDMDFLELPTTNLCLEGAALRKFDRYSLLVMSFLRKIEAFPTLPAMVILPSTSKLSPNLFPEPSPLNQPTEGAHFLRELQTVAVAIIHLSQPTTQLEVINNRMNDKHLPSPRDLPLGLLTLKHIFTMFLSMLQDIGTPGSSHLSPTTALYEIVNRLLLLPKQSKPDAVKRYRTIIRSTLGILYPSSSQDEFLRYAVGQETGAVQNGLFLFGVIHTIIRDLDAKWAMHGLSPFTEEIFEYLIKLLENALISGPLEDIEVAEQICGVLTKNFSIGAESIPQSSPSPPRGFRQNILDIKTPSHSKDFVKIRGTTESL
ncbi:hypothetical protein H0H87_000658, partial [Tephrocybe sp. NHM501043]